MTSDPSPAEFRWRVSWLAGTAVPRTAGATWTPPVPEGVRRLQEVGVTAEGFANGLVRVFGGRSVDPVPEPDPAWLQAPTLAELDPAPPCVVTLYRAAIPDDPAEVIRRMDREAERWKRRRLYVGR